MVANGLHSSTEPDDWMTTFRIALVYTAYYMSLGCIQPFLPVYYQSLGYGGTIIGLIGSITPFTTFLAGPLWGVVSDRTGNHFAVLYITLITSLLGQLLVAVFDTPEHVMAVVCIGSVFGAPVRSLIDTVVLEQMKDRSQYGKMRIWSLIGTGIGTGLAGRFLASQGQPSEPLAWSATASLMENLTLLWEGLSGYRLLFFAHAVLHVPVFMSLRWFQVNGGVVGKKTSKSSPLKSEEVSFQNVASSILRNFDSVIFFSLVYAMGISGGLADNFSYVRFEEVGGDAANMGMSRFLSSISGAVMFWYSSSLSAWLGMESVMLWSLLSVAFRFMLYVIMDHPYYGYFAEILRGMTFGTFWSTSTVYANQIAPNGARATMLQLLNGAYNGIGRSTGAVIGGRVQAEVGTKDTFLYGATLNLVLAGVLMVYTRLGRTGQFGKSKDLVKDL